MIQTIMKDGICAECGTMEQDGLSCSEQFGYLLAWEHNDPALFALHFWTVSCYLLQHRSYYTTEAYDDLVGLFRDAYDNGWSNSRILKRNRSLTERSKIKITNPVPIEQRQMDLRHWPMTVGDVYAAGEPNAVEQIKKWRNTIRRDYEIGQISPEPCYQQNDGQ